MIYTPENIHGLEVFLDALTYFHGGYNSKDVFEMLEKGLTDVAIAKLTKRDRRTVAKWRKVYERNDDTAPA